MAEKNFIKNETKSEPNVAPKKKAAPKKKPVQVSKRVETSTNDKLPDPSMILSTYDLLIKQLADTEAAQRRKGKPYRIYFVHRKRAELMKMNFKKSLR